MSPLRRPRWSSHFILSFQVMDPISHFAYLHLLYIQQHPGPSQLHRPWPKNLLCVHIVCPQPCLIRVNVWDISHFPGEAQRRNSANQNYHCCQSDPLNNKETRVVPMYLSPGLSDWPWSMVMKQGLWTMWWLFKTFLRAIGNYCARYRVLMINLNKTDRLTGVSNQVTPENSYSCEA